MLGNVYYFKTDKFGAFDRYRVEEGAPLRSADVDFTPYDVERRLYGFAGFAELLRFLGTGKNPARYRKH